MVAALTVQIGQRILHDLHTGFLQGLLRIAAQMGRSAEIAQCEQLVVRADRLSVSEGIAGGAPELTADQAVIQGVLIGRRGRQRPQR